MPLVSRACAGACLREASEACRHACVTMAPWCAFASAGARARARRARPAGMPMCQDGAVMSTRLVLDGAWYRACEGAWRSARRARIELVAAHLMREAIRCAISMQSDELGASELVGARRSLPDERGNQMRSVAIPCNARIKRFCCPPRPRMHSTGSVGTLDATSARGPQTPRGYLMSEAITCAQWQSHAIRCNPRSSNPPRAPITSPEFG